MNARKRAAFFKFHEEISTGAVREVAERSGGWARVLPIMHPSAIRNDEHKLVHLPSSFVSRSPVDCTHYCDPSSVLRLWVQLLASYLLTANDGALLELDMRQKRGR